MTEMSKSEAAKSDENRKKLSADLKEYSEGQIATIQATVAKGTSWSELALFLYTAKTQGLNPLNREIWCYKDHKGNLLIFTGRDGFLKKAQADPRFAGMRSGTVRKNDVFKMDAGSGEVSHAITGTITERGPIIGAWAKVFLKGAESVLEWADNSTYAKASAVWKTHPDAMIQKCAEAHALKKALGFGSLQAEEDWAVDDQGIAVMETKEDRLNEIDLAKKRLLDAFDAYQGEDKDDLMMLCRDKIDAGEFSVTFAQNLMDQLKGANS